MHESMMILQGLVSVIGEINRNLIWKNLYRMFGCSIKTLKQYMWMLAEKSDGSRLFDRGHEDYLETILIEGALPVQTSFSFSLSMEPADSMNLSLEIRDNIFRYTETENLSGSNPAAITAVTFAEVLYKELYFPALKLLAGDANTELIKVFIAKSIDEQYIPFV